MEPVYYLNLNVSSDLSFGYIDVFQDGNDKNFNNINQPISLMLCKIKLIILTYYKLAGCGDFTAPYLIDTQDSLVKYFEEHWIDGHCVSNSYFEKYLFKEEIRDFIRGFNKHAKFIDYYAGIQELKNSMNLMVDYVKMRCQSFAERYGIFFYVYAIEVKNKDSYK